MVDFRGIFLNNMYLAVILENFNGEEVHYNKRLKFYAVQ